MQRNPCGNKSHTVMKWYHTRGVGGVALHHRHYTSVAPASISVLNVNDVMRFLFMVQRCAISTAAEFVTVIVCDLEHFGHDHVS